MENSSRRDVGDEILIAIICKLRNIKETLKGDRKMKTYNDTTLDGLSWREKLAWFCAVLAWVGVICLILISLRG